jgi:riboflavin biosynthesis pyrimidine reductase
VPRRPRAREYRAGVRLLDPDHDREFDEIIAEHVAGPEAVPTDRAFVRLNMIASADGGSAVAGVSGGLGNRDDHAVYQALRASADGVLVGLGTVIAEQYHPPRQDHLRIYVVAPTPDISGDEELFTSGRATIVLPEDVGAVPSGVPELRAGTGQVDLARVLGALAGHVLVAEGGPTLAGALAAAGLIDEFFLTVAPRVVAGTSGRIVRGPDADPSVWHLEHGFVDDSGFLFLRYGHRSPTAPGT